MYNFNIVKLNERIKMYRESRNISLTYLGKLISKSKSTISKYESGTIIPDIMTLLDICNALNIQISELLPEATNEPTAFNYFNIFDTSKVYFYYYTENHLVTSIAELIDNNASDTVKVRFYNGVKNTITYADKSSYYYEGELTYDKTIGYFNLKNTNSKEIQFENIQISFTIPWNGSIDKTFFFILALTPHSVPIVKKGILSTTEIQNIHDYDKYLRISKDDLNKIKYNNAWILNDSNYDDLFFHSKKEF